MNFENLKSSMLTEFCDICWFLTSSAKYIFDVTLTVTRLLPNLHEMDGYGTMSLPLWHYETRMSSIKL